MGFHCLLHCLQFCMVKWQLMQAFVVLHMKYILHKWSPQNKLMHNNTLQNMFKNILHLHNVQKAVSHCNSWVFILLHAAVDIHTHTVWGHKYQLNPDWNTSSTTQRENERKGTPLTWKRGGCLPGQAKKLSNRTKCIIWGQYLPEHMLSLLSCLTPWLSTLPTAEWVMGTHTAFIFSTLGYNDLSSCPSLLWLANQSTYLFSCRSGIRDAMAGQSKQTARKVRARQITIVCREIIKIFLFSL